MAKVTKSTNKEVKSKPSKTTTVSRKPVSKTDADKIRALEEQLAQRDAQLAIIDSIQTALASRLDFQRIIDVVGDKVSEIFADGNVGIALLDKARETIAFPYIIENGKRIGYFELALAESGLMQHILKRRRPVVINSKFGERFEGIGTFNYPGRDQRDLKSWVTVPIFNGDEIIGGASLRSWDRENAFSDSDIRLLQTIVNSMSVAIENIRLFDETQRLLKETEQRATELQIINNIGQTLTEGLDLQSTLERVGERLREALNIKSLGIVAFDPQAGSVISNYFYHYGRRFTPQLSINDYKLSMRLASRVGYKPLAVNTNAERYWKKFLTGILPEWKEVPKAFFVVPLLAGGELVGSITIGDYENENAFVNLPLNLLETIASNMGTAIQNVRLFDETQRLLKETEQRATELQIINNIGQTLTEGGDLNTIIQHVGERIQEALQVSNLVISLLDKKTGHVLAPYMVRNGKQITITEENIDLNRYKLAVRASARTGGASWVVNTNTEKSWRKFWINPVDNDVPKSFVSMPFLAGKEVIGGITIADYKNENAFSDLSVDLLETIASNMGTAIQNVRLFDETQRLLKETDQRATELQIINNIGQTLTEGLDLNSTLNRVGDRLRESLEVENIGISVWDERLEHIIATYYYRNGKPVSSETWQASDVRAALRLSARGGNKSWVVNRNAKKSWLKFGGVSEPDIPKSFAQLPLIAGGKLIGGITIADYEKEDAFTNLPIGMLETIASNLGTAIQNARLFDETQRLLKETEQRAAELQIINNIGITLTEGLDLDSTLERVTKRLHETLHMDNIAITIADPNVDVIIAQYFHSNCSSFVANRFSFRKYRMGIRMSAKGMGRSWVVKKNVEKSWRKFAGDFLEDDRIPKSFILLPLLVGKEAIGGITIPDYDNENAFDDISTSMLETIAANMGTAIQNVHLFDETQRLLKETEQRAAELQIINNIGQTITGELDLNILLEGVGDKLREAFSLKSIRIAVADINTGLLISLYMYRNGKRVAFDESWQSKSDKFRSIMRASARGGGRSWVVNTNAEKGWRKFALVIDEDDIPKSFVMLPLLAGREVIGGIYIPNYEKENAFTDFSIGMLETIASNMGTAIQNVRLFDETQRLLKETEQRATELQVINNIGQTLTEGLDLQSTLERVGDRLREALKVESIGIIANDIRTGLVISAFVYLKGKRVIPDSYSLSKNMLFMRFVERMGGKPVVINTNVEKNWRKFLADSPEWAEIPKAFVMVPLLAGGELVGSITIPDYEREDAFTDLPINMLGTIASNMGTAIQNVRLFDETKQLFQEAEEARASAEHANKAKSTFLANMSHELRTPLNAIMGFTSLVRDKSQGVLPEKQINNLEKVLASSQHLLGLINTVLDLAKIEAGRMDVIPAKFNLGALIDLCSSISTPLLKPNVTLEKQVDETISIIYSDQDKIKQILLNLLSNAAKFTHQGRVLLTVEKPDSETLNISVTDSGIGIKADAIDRVFEEFQQADTTTTRQYGGTGLGLPISRNLARLLGGDLIATSELGKGSTFTLTIPIQYGKKPASSSNLKPASVQSTESNSQTGSA